jgi:hypothetical protein
VRLKIPRGAQRIGGGGSMSRYDVNFEIKESGQVTQNLAKVRDQNSSLLLKFVCFLKFLCRDFIKLTSNL